MALKTIGPGTHIWNNKLRSAFLLTLLPVIAFGVVYGCLAVLGAAGMDDWLLDTRVATEIREDCSFPDADPRVGPYMRRSCADEIKVKYGLKLPRELQGMISVPADPRRVAAYEEYKAKRETPPSMVDKGHWGLLVLLAWIGFSWRSHGAMIEAASQATPALPGGMPRVENMLERLAIASGVPTPELHVIESSYLNAFASGLGPKTGRITVTQGLLDTLSEDELEAVFAHELTHIVNGDARTLIIATVFTGLLALLAEMLLHSLLRLLVPRDSGLLKAILAVTGILVLAALISAIVRSVVAQDREYIADAGAIELTKKPEALMSALQRVAQRSGVPDLPPSIKQMCIDNQTPFLGGLHTHPPMARRLDRIARLYGTPIPGPA